MKLALAVILILTLFAGYIAGRTNFISPAPVAVAAAAAADSCQTFQETGFKVCGQFLSYWQSHGGLAQQGLPITGEFNELNAPPPAGDGKIHKVQYFERARFEEHLENQPPYNVLLGLLGSEQVRAKYPNGAPQGGANPAPTTRVTPVVGNVVFLSVQGGRPGQMANVLVQTLPNAACSIFYTTPKGNVSQAKGLDSKQAGADGRVSWTWLIGTNTTPGVGQVDVYCNGVYASSPITIG